jgi:hypothetical protein
MRLARVALVLAYSHLAHARSLVPGLDELASTATFPPNAAGAAAGTTSNSWCPDQVGLPVAELLKRGNLHWNSDYNHSARGRCDLTRTKWLFVVSLGGRTGSTTVLEMINSHPAFNLAGENHGQLMNAKAMWDLAADHDTHPNAAWGRGAVHPHDLLCDIAAWFEDVAIGGTPGELDQFLKHRREQLIRTPRDAGKGVLPMPEATASKAGAGSASSEAGTAGTPLQAGRYEAETPLDDSVVQPVLGFKEIRWGTDLSLLNFLNAVFPCHRIVYSYREEGQNPLVQGVTWDEARRFSQGRPDWQDYWITLHRDGFRLGEFNNMLSWAGEPSPECRYLRVVDFNANKTFDNDHSIDQGWVFGEWQDGDPVIDASKCRLRFTGGPDRSTVTCPFPCDRQEEQLAAR